MAEWRHALPQSRYPLARGFRRDRQAGAARELQEPYADLARPGRASRQPPAVHRSGLRRDSCAQCWAQPGAIYQSLRRAGDPPAEWALGMVQTYAMMAGLVMVTAIYILLHADLVSYPHEADQ